jgi:hypothetical protein
LKEKVDELWDLKLLPENPKFAELLDYATLLRDEGKYDQSEALYVRSLDTWKEAGIRRTRRSPGH